MKKKKRKKKTQGKTPTLFDLMKNTQKDIVKNNVEKDRPKNDIS